MEFDSIFLLPVPVVGTFSKLDRPIVRFYQHSLPTKSSLDFLIDCVLLPCVAPRADVMSGSGVDGSSDGDGASHALPWSGRVVVALERTNSIPSERGGHYVQYVYLLQNDRHRWRIRRRYSDFSRLHLKLASEVKGFALDLPPKALLHSPEDFLEDRKERLRAYCQELADQFAADNQAVLRFLGMVPPGVPGRQLIALSSIATGGPAGLAVGDVVLFRCRNTAAALQRRATSAEFDHVGIVMPLSVRDKVAIKILKRKSSYRPADFKAESTLVLLESTTAGVAAHPLAEHLRSYDHFDCAHYICVRKLVRGGSLTHEELALSFLPTVLGKKYRFNANDIFRFLSSSGGPSSERSDRSDRDSFFCSEVVAAAMKAMGLMMADVSEHRIYPGDFASGARVDALLCEGVSYGEELVIDFRTVQGAGSADSEGAGDVRLPDAPFAASVV